VITQGCGESGVDFGSWGGFGEWAFSQGLQRRTGLYAVQVAECLGGGLERLLPRCP